MDYAKITKNRRKGIYELVDAGYYDVSGFAKVYGVSEKIIENDVKALDLNIPQEPKAFSPQKYLDKVIIPRIKRIHQRPEIEAERAGLTYHPFKSMEPVSKFYEMVAEKEILTENIPMPKMGIIPPKEIYNKAPESGLTKLVLNRRAALASLVNRQYYDVNEFAKAFGVDESVIEEDIQQMNLQKPDNVKVFDAKDYIENEIVPKMKVMHRTAEQEAERFGLTYHPTRDINKITKPRKYFQTSKSNYQEFANRLEQLINIYEVPVNIDKFKESAPVAHRISTHDDDTCKNAYQKFVMHANGCAVEKKLNHKDVSHNITFKPDDNKWNTFKENNIIEQEKVRIDWLDKKDDFDLDFEY